MKKWTSQWTQFMQLRKETWKKKKKIQDFNGVDDHIWLISYIINNSLMS